MPEPTEDDDVVLICARVGDPTATVIKGTVINNCHDCNVRIYTAPSGQQLLAEQPEALAVCNRCGNKRFQKARAEGEETNIYVRSESIWELREHLGGGPTFH